MGLVHTSGIELGRYMSLAKECSKVRNLKGKKCLYLDFDGKELGLANRLLGGAITTLHVRDEAITSLDKTVFTGRNKVEWVISPRLHDDLIKSGKYDVLIWWRGPSSKEDYSFLNSVKNFFKELVIVGCVESDMGKLDGFTYTEFCDLGLAFIEPEFGVDVPSKPKSRKRVVKAEPPIESVEPVKSEETPIDPVAPTVEEPVEDIPAQEPTPVEPEAEPSAPEPVKELKPMTGQQVTTGEMKTEATMALTNIRSSSSSVQEMAQPQEKPKKKRARKKKEKPVVDAEAFLADASDESKLETAFLLVGSLPDSVEEAEAVIRAASPEELGVVC